GGCRAGVRPPAAWPGPGGDATGRTAARGVVGRAAPERGRPPVKQNTLFPDTGCVRPCSRAGKEYGEMDARLTPPLKWHGGKRYVGPHVLRLMPPHLHYVEPYFGGGQVFFARDPADRRLWWPNLTSDGRRPDGVSEVLNDLHADLMNFY